MPPTHEGTTDAKHAVLRSDVPTDDVERAKAFYGGLFDWEFSPAEGFPDYWMFVTGDPEADAGGGLMGRQAPEQMDLVAAPASSPSTTPSSGSRNGEARS